MSAGLLAFKNPCTHANFSVTAASMIPPGELTCVGLLFAGEGAGPGGWLCVFVQVYHGMHLYAVLGSAV